MFYKLRLIPFAYYRLLFAVLLFAVGLFCFVHLALDYFYGYKVITTALPSDHGAVFVGVAICGFLSTMFGFIMISLLVDRRVKGTDRRQRQLPIDFPERRSGVDRRDGQELSS